MAHTYVEEDERLFVLLQLLKLGHAHLVDGRKLLADHGLSGHHRQPRTHCWMSRAAPPSASAGTQGDQLVF